MDYSKQGISPTIATAGGGQTYPAVPRIRRLTPLECERLQGFPDNWTAVGRTHLDGAEGINTMEVISDTQRYKMCGNAVTVNTVEAVMTNLIKHMEN